MAAEAPPLFASYPAGFPSGVGAGRSLALQLFLPGAPKPKGRHRARAVTPGGGRRPYVQFYPDKDTEEWEINAGEALRVQLLAVEIQGDDDFTLPLDGRILMTLRFNMRKPSGYPKRVTQHVVKPDLDNLCKSILDALVMAKVIVDDNSITELTLAKHYEEQGHPEGIEIDMTVIPVERHA